MAHRGRAGTKPCNSHAVSVVPGEPFHFFSSLKDANAADPPQERDERSLTVRIAEPARG